ncbi:MAG: 3-phosphoshikimate 1-carboxyvinyltransferase [Candidatus Bipolaricaulia bacterium]
MDAHIRPIGGLRGEASVPGDKSISHRALLLGAVARDQTNITGLASGGDLRSTAECVSALGVTVETAGDVTRIAGCSLRGLKQPDRELDAGNSGTTIRLIAGLLAGQRFTTTITGDEQLRRRPMDRIIEPLEAMGAEVHGVDDRFAPLIISGGHLRATTYRPRIASAQVKSCVLLAGLYAAGRTTVVEPAISRDHTERMLRYLGVEVEERRSPGRGNQVTLTRGAQPVARPISIPGDLSSAAFLITAALITQNSALTLPGVGVNETRTGLLDVLGEMGAEVSIRNRRAHNLEPRADLVVRSSELRGIEIGGELIPRLIDEIPLLAVAAACAHGKTTVRDAGELRVKETDRIRAMVEGLRRMGARVEEREDGMVIEGGRPLHGTTVSSFADHRIAMAFAVAGLATDGETTVRDAEWVDISFPGFFDLLESLTQ